MFPLPSNTPPVNCPTCGTAKILSNITIAWVQAGDSLLPERGHFCTSCSKPFKAPLNGDIPFVQFLLIPVDHLTRFLELLLVRGEIVRFG